MLQCVRCEALLCTVCAEPCRGCELLAAIRAVQSGARPRADAAFRDADEKTLHIVRTLGAARDVLLSALGIAVRVLGDPRRHGYFPRAAPFVLSDTLDRAGIATLDRPYLAQVEGGRVWAAVSQAADAELAWFFPRAQGVEIRFRPLPPEGGPARPIAIDETTVTTAPWSEPAWSPPTPVFVDGTGVACAHCSANAPAYRVVRDRPEAFVCPTCGRSFRHATLAARRS